MIKHRVSAVNITLFIAFLFFIMGSAKEVISKSSSISNGKLVVAIYYSPPLSMISSNSIVPYSSYILMVNARAKAVMLTATTIPVSISAVGRGFI